jgi:hypothetical protein
MLLLAVILASSPLGARCQGTFVYDQQSSTDETPANFGSGGDIMHSPPGQSFTPALSALNFIRLNFDDGRTFDGFGATVYVNLRSGSITGTILGTSTPVAMRPTFAGVTNFLFATSIALTPGTTYFMEVVQLDGGPWNIAVGPYNYPGGIAFNGGTPTPGADLWFREGIYVVPEPASASLLVLSLAALVGLRPRCCRGAVST